MPAALNRAAMFTLVTQSLHQTNYVWKTPINDQFNKSDIKLMAQFEEVEDAVGVYHCLCQSKKAVFFKVAEQCVIDREEEIEIPVFAKANNNDCPVVAMGRKAFFEMERLKKISFPPESQVSLFQAAAFMSETLEEVELPAQTRYIDSGAFMGARGLRNVTVNENNKEFVRGEDGCLYTADRSTLVFVPRDKEGRFDVPASVKEIGGYAFHLCSKITQIVLDQSANLEKIGEGAFSETAITEFTLPTSVSELGACAFRRCRKLENVSFGVGTRIQEFGSRLFEGCMAVKSLIVPKSVKVLRSGCLSRMSTVEERDRPQNIMGLETLKFEAGSNLKVIQAHVFCDLPVTEIELPDSLVELNELNFHGCDNIQEFVIGTGNRKLKWDGNVLTSMNNDTIHYAKRDITSYEIPDCVKVVTYCAFHRCRKLTNVRLTYDQPVLERIGPFAFADTGIIAFYLPGSLKVIEHDAFSGCASLKRLVFPDEEMSSLTRIDNHAFSRTGLGKVLIPDKVQTIGGHVFANSSVSFVKWPRTVLTIPAGTFAYCKSLEKLVLFAEADVYVSSSAFKHVNKDNDQLKQIIMCRDSVTVHDDTGTPIDVTKGDVELACTGIEELPLAQPITEPLLDKTKLILDPQDWQKEKKIGSGGFGDVYLVRRSDNCLAVVKHPKWHDNYEDFWKEVDVLSRIRHPATCGIIGATLATQENPEAGLYLEYCSNQSLSDKIFKPNIRQSVLRPTVLAKIVAGICYGMRYVHEMGVIHTDFKPGNVLLNEKFEPKIADFGSATIVNQTATVTQTIGAMTPKYKAPEIDMRGVQALTMSADVYAFGVSLWEILTGMEFEKDECFQKSKFSFAGQIRDGTRPDLDKTLAYADPVVRDVIRSSWSVQPSDRLTFDQIIKKMEKIQWRVTRNDPDSADLDKYIQEIKDWEQKWPPEGRVPQ